MIAQAVFHPALADMDCHCHALPAQSYCSLSHFGGLTCWEEQLGCCLAAPRYVTTPSRYYTQPNDRHTDNITVPNKLNNKA